MTIKSVPANITYVASGIKWNVKTNINIVKTARKNKKHAKMIKASQDKIGPYKPVSYTQVWA